MADRSICILLVFVFQFYVRAKYSFPLLHPLHSHLSPLSCTRLFQSLHRKCSTLHLAIPSDLLTCPSSPFPSSQTNAPLTSSSPQSEYINPPPLPLPFLPPFFFLSAQRRGVQIYWIGVQTERRRNGTKKTALRLMGGSCLGEFENKMESAAAMGVVGVEILMGIWGVKNRITPDSWVGDGVEI